MNDTRAATGSTSSTHHWAPTSEPSHQPEAVKQLYDRYVVPSYGRFDLVLSHGKGSRVWDVSGRSLLDLGGGIAVCSLGHAHPEIADTLYQQAQQLVHISNLYYHESQGRLAEKIVHHLGLPGKVFFCNSGAEANEGLYKLARKVGHDHGRYEVLTTVNSFHGRTLGGISATGQDKVKKGFEPMIDGFRSDLPFNDLAAMEAAITPKTAAILIEGIQGEGGLTPATAEYLLGLRRLCDQHDLLLMLDAVQCGHFRSGSYQSYQRILENHPAPEAKTFAPDAISMAKSLGGGFPLGAFWVQQKYADMLGPGSHGTTYGGSPLGCAVALKIMDIIERDQLQKNVREVGHLLHTRLQALHERYPQVITAVRGLGFMVGFVLAAKEDIPAFAAQDTPASLQLVNHLHAAGLMSVPSGTQVIRLLPALNLTMSEAHEALDIIEKTISKLG